MTNRGPLITLGSAVLLGGILLATNQAIAKPEGPAPAHPAAAAKPSAPLRGSVNLAQLNATMCSPATRRYGLPRADRRVADLVPVALHEQGMALLTMRVRLPIAKGEAPCCR
jgi:hypothetical protein